MENVIRDTASRICGATLYAGAGVAGNGEWFPFVDMAIATFSVTGTFVGTVVVCVSNATEKPADAVHEAPYDTLSVPGAICVVGPWKWCKAYISAYTSGAINVSMQARAERM